ncbi:hypothetical protein PoB_003985300 [Plakobranchus ocellatus]|uniref:Uncharacterized protein n=1 Tax=Plakobranchus ocellatus TaxID=259542 RepID=A0AAV4B3K8_9GAST|nr:hypothetical protein PoB_003985300 [Plakobranchus ocellatus]
MFHWNDPRTASQAPSLPSTPAVSHDYELTQQCDPLYGSGSTDDLQIRGMVLKKHNKSLHLPYHNSSSALFFSLHGTLMFVAAVLTGAYQSSSTTTTITSNSTSSMYPPMYLSPARQLHSITME